MRVIGLMGNKMEKEGMYFQMEQKKWDFGKTVGELSGQMVKKIM